VNEPTTTRTCTRVTLKNGASAVVRPVRVEDAPDILEMTRLVHELDLGVVRTMDEIPANLEAQQRELQSWVKGIRSPPNGQMMVCEVGGQVRGAGSVRRMMYERMRHTGHIGLAVHPEWQGLGIGRAIMEALIEWANSDESEGITRLDLSALADNHRAMKLYESLGFAHEGIRRSSVRRDDGTLVDDVLMARLLDE